MEIISKSTNTSPFPPWINDEITITLTGRQLIALAYMSESWESGGVFPSTNRLWQVINEAMGITDDYDFSTDSTIKTWFDMIYKVQRRVSWD